MNHVMCRMKHIKVIGLRDVSDMSMQVCITDSLMLVIAWRLLLGWISRNFKISFLRGNQKKISLLKLFEIFEIIDENSHCPNDHFQGNNESHIKGEFVKIREFNLVLIALIFIQKWQFRLKWNFLEFSLGTIR